METIPKPSVQPKKVLPKNEFYVEEMSATDTKWTAIQIKVHKIKIILFSFLF